MGLRVAPRAERKHSSRGLTDAQVIDFVDRFAPTYDACLQNLFDRVESKRLEDNMSAMLIEVNKDRSVKMNNEQVETIHGDFEESERAWNAKKRRIA